MSVKGFFKIFILGCLSLGLTIALFAVRDIVSERSQRRAQVYQEMEQTSAGKQVLAGPFLVLPYELRTPTTVVDDKGQKKSSLEVTRKQIVIQPRQLTINGRLEAQLRYRSLYEILLYRTQLRLEGNFDFTPPKDLSVPEGSSVRWLQPYTTVTVQDNRGLLMPKLTWNAQSYRVEPGHRELETPMEGGFYASLPAGLEAGGRFPFVIEMSLDGMQSFAWLPVGDEMRVHLQSNWPHPSFQGRALPSSHSISDEGFEATWETSQFSNNHADGTNLLHQVGVRLIQPVDVYQQAERSVKYGFLFIALTFAGFWLFEVMKHLAIHPVQYGLVGLALVLFYVLLLALSEHIPFVWAYVLSSVASLALLGYYIRFVVHSWKHALGFALALAFGDAAIYGILISEDYALLYGACLLFLLLATVMIVTRKVNWNGELRD